MKSTAERMRAYRARKKERGEPVSRGVSNKSYSMFAAGQFIALDGEGESSGELEKITVGKDGKIYESRNHNYTLLAASTGEYIFSKDNRLDSHDCIEFLLNLSRHYPKAIFIIFAGGYDINHMLMFGFGREVLQQISRGGVYQYERGGTTYAIEYRARKSLTIRSGLRFVEGKDGKVKPKWDISMTVWDVFGFFQENFVGVMRKWLGEDYKHFALIKDMKARRGDFANVSQKRINAYNAAELESLVEIMNKVRDAITGLGLTCKRWDGAGAIAAAIMQKHHIKEYKKPTDPNIIDAVCTAYAGGRIEVCKIGTHDGYVYDYDINSAYPAMMQHVPCLRHGKWMHGTGPVPSAFTLVHVKFHFAKGLRFYPLFYRTDKMQISFPQVGEGWYWYPEYEAALQCPGHIEVIEHYTWIPYCEDKPFSWIEEYYETRKKWVKNPTEEWQRGGEKIIKLGLNSLYGKTAQQLGARNGVPPAYHQMEWAGFITASTRARLYRAAILKPDAVIGFATDGIFTTTPLQIEISDKKEIGKWELKQPVPIGITIAMAGVYWWHYGDDEYSHFSRGFDKDSMRTPHNINEAWRKGKCEIDISMHRLIGMGSACASNALWEMRGRFTEGFRTLRLDGRSHKRRAINIVKEKPHLQLVDLEPSINIEYETGLQECSHPYPVDWRGETHTDEYENDLELVRDINDTYNV